MKFFVIGALALASSSAMAVDFVNPNFAGDASGWSVLDCFFGGYQSFAGQDGNPGYVWLNSDGGPEVPRIEQTVSGFNVGDTYTVSGYYKTGVVFNPGDPFLALVNGNVAFTAPNQQILDWTQFSYNFTATQASNTFTFEAEVLKDSDYYVDSFAITNSTPVPEPATIAALGAGLALIRRKRKQD